MFLVLPLNAQLSVQSNQTYVLDFDGSISGVHQAFTGAGLSTNPSAGQLDAEAWAITGFSDGSQVFGQTATSGDFARGNSSGGVTTGGLYAFEVASNNTALGVQPGGSDWTPGTITLKIINSSNSTIEDIDLSYLLYVRNDQNRSNSFNFSYSTDGSNFQSVSSLDFASITNADANPSWQQSTKSINLSNLSLTSNASLYLRWSGNDLGGSGSRDEFAIDDISISTSGSGPVNCNQPNNQASNLSFGTITSNAIEVNFTPSTDHSLVLISSSANLSAFPIDGTSYSAGTNLGNASVLGYGNDSNYTASGLQESNTYYFFVFAANDNCNGAPDYLNSNPLQGSASTLNNSNSGYYSSIGNQQCEELKTALYNLINSHNTVSYNSLWTHYQTTDDHSNDSGNEIIVWDIYSDNPTGAENEFTFVAEQCGSYSGEGSCYNREHTFPKSWWGGSASTPMYTDLFTVLPVDGWINGIRNNNPYGEVLSGTESHITNNGSKLGASEISIPGYTGSVFEPIDEYKGDLARGYFYMVTCYENLIPNWENSSSEGDAILDGTSFPAFEPWMIDMLLSWHLNDPVSQKEIDRNNTAYNIQGNRNPYIDHPEYVNLIWGSCSGGSDTEAPTTPLNLTGNNVTENSVDLTWSLSSDNVGVSSYNVYQNGTLIASVTNNNTAVSSLTASTNYLFQVSAVDAAGNESSLSPNLGITTASSSAPVILNEGYFESGWDGWADGGNDCARKASYAFEGNYAIRIRDNSGTASSMTSPALDLSAYNQVEIQFSFYVRSMENNEDFWLLFFDGSDWINVATYTRGINISNNQFYTETITLNSSDFDFGSYHKFRFRCDASGNGDQIFIDAVTISASQGTSTNSSARPVIGELNFPIHLAQKDSKKPIEAITPTVNVFPNPTKDYVTIDSKGNILKSILVFNVNGNLIQEVQVNQSSIRLDLSAFNKGLYYLQIVNENQQVVYKRIMIQ